MKTFETESFEHLGHFTDHRDIKVLLGLIDSIHQKRCPATVIEIGCWTGYTTRHLADRGAIVYCIDNFAGLPSDSVSPTTGGNAARDAFIKNMGHRLGRTVHLIEASEEEAFDTSNVFGEGTPDIIFYDAAHTEQDVLDAYDRWAGILAYDGYYCIHDVMSHQGTRDAVDTMIYDLGILADVKIVGNMAVINNGRL